MDKKKKRRLLIFAFIVGIGLLLLFLFRAGPKGQAAGNLQASSSAPFTGLGVPAGGPGPTSSGFNFPSPGGCSCKVSFCDTEGLQVKEAPNWTNSYLSDTFGVNGGSLDFNYGGQTPTQIFGIYI